MEAGTDLDGERVKLAKVRKERLATGDGEKDPSEQVVVFRADEDWKGV
jgi:hypothetical protein